jgi:hypothetical protein
LKAELEGVKTEQVKMNEILMSLSVDVKKMMKFNVAMLSQVSNMLVPDALNVLAKARTQAASKVAIAADVVLPRAVAR